MSTLWKTRFSENDIVIPYSDLGFCIAPQIIEEDRMTNRLEGVFIGSGWIQHGKDNFARCISRAEEHMNSGWSKEQKLEVLGMMRRLHGKELIPLSQFDITANAYDKSDSFEFDLKIVKHIVFAAGGYFWIDLPGHSGYFAIRKGNTIHYAYPVGSNPNYPEEKKVSVTDILATTVTERMNDNGVNVPIVIRSRKKGNRRG